MLGRKTVSSIQAPLRLQCVVIGAGAIGLASAIALARVGHRVLLLEQTPDLEHIHPGGFALPPNATKVLFKWGLRDAFETFATRWRTVAFLQWLTGDEYGTHDWDQEALEESGGDWAFAEFIVFYRFMVETARLSGVEIRTASRVEAVAEDGASVQLANGQTVHADIIVGAGGLDCVLRQELFKTQNDKQEKLAPMLGFNCHIHGEKMRADPELLSLWENDSVCTTWWGTGYASGFRKGNSNEYTLELFIPFSDAENRSRPWDARLPTDDMLTILGTGEPRLAKLVALGTSFGGEPFVNRPVVENWVHPSGRAVVIGGAAHPTMLGSVAMQGTAMGLEDAAALGQLLSRVSRRDQIPVLLNGYAGLRQPRAFNLNALESQQPPFTPGPELDPNASHEEIAAHIHTQYLNSLRVLGCELSGEELWDAVGRVWAYDAEEVAEDWWVEWGLPAERAKGTAPALQHIPPAAVRVEREIELGP